jgi:hypothetical protein
MKEASQVWFVIFTPFEFPLDAGMFSGIANMQFCVWIHLEEAGLGGMYRRIG